MGFSDLTNPSAVLQAIAEYDTLGRDAFLQRYGFGPSRRFYLSHEGRLYDSKAIVGGAHGFQHPELGPLRAADFSGGEATVQRKFEQLGFDVEVVDPKSSHDSLDGSEATVEAELVAAGAFSPADVEDARRRTLAAIVQRRGQRAFREALMRAYDSRCAITGSGVSEVLEAAHIHPYRGDATNQVTNGLLLRADVHTLFDYGLIAIDEDAKVRTAAALAGTEYERYRGARLSLPSDTRLHPSAEALRFHRAQAGL